LVVGNERQRIPLESAILPMDERMYVSIMNTGSQPVFVFLFDVVADVVVLLSNSQPSGKELSPGQSYCFGEIDLVGKLEGALITWPPNIPPAESIPETLLVIVTDRLINLQSLERRHGRGGEKIRGHGAGTNLAELMDWIAVGGLRFSGPEMQSYQHIQFGIRKFHYELKSQR